MLVSLRPGGGRQSDDVLAFTVLATRGNDRSRAGIVKTWPPIWSMLRRLHRVRQGGAIGRRRVAPARALC